MVCVYIGMKTISNVNLANYCQSSSFHLLVCLRKSIDAILAICKFVPGKIISFFMNIFTKDILFLYTKKKNTLPGKFAICLGKSRLDFQPFCAPAFLRAHHGWITGLPYCIFDQSETCLHESCRQVSDWSIQSRQQQRWRLSLRKNFLLPTKSVSELFKIGNLGNTSKSTR